MRKGQPLLRKIKHHSTIPWQRSTGASGGKSLDKLMQEFEDELKSVALAFQTNVGLNSTPSCLVGSRLFPARTDESFNVVLPYSAGIIPTGTVAANYIIRDANTYQIPIRNNATGAFCVKYISVYISQRIYNANIKKETFVRVPTNRLSGNTSSFKYAMYNMYALTGGFNYFWNIEDAKSGRLLGDDLMSHLVMTPRTNPYQAAYDSVNYLNTVLNNNQTFDGDFFELEVPWIIERDGQVNFHFRPITPLMQFDSSISDGRTTTNSYVGDTREAGIRRQDATVYIELHGHKIKSDQDLMKIGALTHSTDLG